MSNEVWRDVTGYEGLYQVSNQGRVRGLKRGGILKPGSTGKYLFVVLCKDGKRKDSLVHRLVAKEFCERESDSQNQVNHINEIGTDNRAENLEWITPIANIRYGTGIKRHSEAQKSGKKNKAICQYSLGGELVCKYPSTREAARVNNFDRSLIFRCLTGKRPTAYGYMWQYAT